MNMFQKLLTNKKILIAVIAFFLVSIIGIVIVVTPNTSKTDGKGTNTKTEKSKEDEDSQDNKYDTEKDDESDNKKDDKENQNATLEVLEPDKVIPENSSDASGAWGDTDSTDNNSNGEEPDKDEDILKDDIVWGRPY